MRVKNDMRIELTTLEIEKKKIIKGNKRSKLPNYNEKVRKTGVTCRSTHPYPNFHEFGSTNIFRSPKKCTHAHI